VLELAVANWIILTVATLSVLGNIVLVWMLITRTSELSRLRMQEAVFSEQRREMESRLEEGLEQKARLESSNEELREAREVFEKRNIELQTVLNKEREAANEKIQLLEKAEKSLKDAFQSLSSEALRSNNASFLELAQTAFSKLQAGAKGDLEVRKKEISEMVKPINESLKNVDERIIQMEKGRASQISTVSELIQNLTKANEATRLETQNLATSLRAPTTRGQWGELQLRRTIEIAGMVKYCDFVEQEQLSRDGQKYRPDVMVRLPNDRVVIIDAKVPLSSYLEAYESKDPSDREAKLKQHAGQIRQHMKQLGQKSYHDLVDETPEFVVMFLPGESFFSAALEQDPGLIEFGVEQRTLIATPTTLIALLKSIAYGWKNQEIAEQAQEIAKAGKDLYDSIVIMLEHTVNVGRYLNQSVRAYNQSVASTSKRVLPRARKFQDLNAGSDRALPELSEVEKEAEIFEVPETDKVTE
jgi:DNA recombination protein RmuC